MSSCRCLDSLLFEHTEKGSSVTKKVLSCGDKIDARLDGKVLIANITITFRSNEQVTKNGARLLVEEFLATVCKLVSVFVVVTYGTIHSSE